MPARSHDRIAQDGTARRVISSAVGAAEALSVGVLRLTSRTLVEAVRAVEDIGNELGSGAVRAARGTIKAAEDIGGDLLQIGADVSRAVSEPARQLGGKVGRLAAGVPKNKTKAGRTAPARKPLAKAAGPRRRRRSAA
jgi:hypothetical protein